MKKLSLVLLALLALACTEKNNPEPEDSLVFESAKSFTSDAAGTELNLAFTASANWSSVNTFDWLTLSPASGAQGKATPVLTVSENTARATRKGYVVIKSGKLQDTVRVSQAGADYLFAEPVVFNVGNNGGTYFSKISANVDFSMQLEPSTASSWLKTDLAAANAQGERNLCITVEKNDDVHNREAKINFVSSKLSAEISVSQTGQTPVFTVTVGDVQSPAAGTTFSVPVTTNLEVTATTPSWITATRTFAGFDFTVSANTGDALRSGNVTISSTEYSKSASFKVSQKSPKSLYILAIGNSFSWDAMEYLYQILQELGYKDIFLGNLYIGGCTLATHANNITQNSGAYEYRTNSNGSWGSTNGFSANTAMKERDWDFVSMQQASGSSGMPDTYDPYLSTIVAAVKKNCPNAKRMWHMTWAYQGNSTHSEFSKYGKNQMAMYEAIVNCVKTKVVARGDFDFVIPCGTAVQNLRTSYLGDTITRDGYHMSYNNGRLLTGLMWARQITGKSIADITYKPSSYSYTTDQITVIKDAVEKAYVKPYEVTESVIPPTPPEYIYPTDELKALFTGAGYDLAQYDPLPLDITLKAYYNSTSSSNVVSAATGSTASNLVQFAATQIFTKSQIPNGSVIVLKSGYQYRPEGWTDLTTKNASSARPANVKTSIVVVDDAWWGSWNYRAFNLAKESNPNLTDAEQETLKGCFAIFLPK